MSRATRLELGEAALALRANLGLVPRDDALRGLRESGVRSTRSWLQ